MNPAAAAEAAQSRASDPAASAWVSASAGSGKTKLLTDRVLRLMLAGTPPGRILCLTFTKAAAAEMAQRLNRRLGEWAVDDDAQLNTSLTTLLGRAATPAEADLARRLFAEVLELAGGMRIATIHAFCQTLLRAFPLEAGLPPQFTVLEESDAAATLAEAREDALARAAGSGALAEVAGLIAAERFADLARDATRDGAKLDEAMEQSGGLDALIRVLEHALGAAGEDDATLRHEAATGCDDTALRRAQAALIASRNENDQDRGRRLDAWLRLDATGRAARFEEHRDFLLTTEGTVRKSFATKTGMGAPAAATHNALLQDEGARIRDIAARMNALRLAAATRALLATATPVLHAYRAAKQARAQLDFDDLIRATERLLKDPGSAWVLYKLDSGIEHVLLDEAQDSNPAQWGIMQALTSEFFAGETAQERPRTVFAVGDVKQSIYAFQGADPEGFAKARAYFEPRVRAAGGVFRDVPLDVSFRSTPAVLELVDAVFAGADARDGVLPPEAPPLRHTAHRAGQGGVVELWPLLVATPTPAPPPWAIPEAAEAEENAQAQLARALAQRIAAMIGHEELPSRQRTIRPDDILVLVRQRNLLTRLLIRELKAAGVPVGGLDRIALTAQIGVMDVLALLDVALLPEDDLQLAALLKSPLVGLDEDALFRLAHGRERSLHATLMAHRGGQGEFARAADWLALWCSRADRATPHALLAELLGAGGARAALLARLGPDAADGLDELLNAALVHEARHPPSLQGFLHWLREGGAEVKRDAESAHGQVRIMTAHGAKGLQAPVVILPDTISRARPDSGLRWLQEGANHPLPLWIPRKEVPQPEAAERLREAETRRRRQEENRLLYVALTRAEDRLLIAGWTRHQKAPEHDWYSRAAQGFAGLQARELPFDQPGFNGPLLRHESPQTAPPRPEAARPHAAALALPEWALRAAPSEAEAMLAPSDLADAESGPPAAAPHAPGDPLGLRFRRGRLIHALLQHVPALPEADRAEAAARFLARPGHGLAAQVQVEIAREALALLHHPVFAPGSLAEAPIAGRIHGRLFSGQVDRLLVTPGHITVVDYKTNRPVPRGTETVPVVYLRQMAAYRALLRASFPGRSVACALLWTYSAELMPLPDGLLDAHAP